MIANDEAKIDPNQYKGILPAHMRQGIPPYLQILFAARPKLPFVPIIEKPHVVKVKGFFENIDYERMKSLHQKSSPTTFIIPEEDLENADSLPEKSKQTFQTAIVKKKKKHIWKTKMENHLNRQKESYKNWLAERKINEGNKSKNPKNTLLVTKLVE